MFRLGRRWGFGPKSPFPLDVNNPIKHNVSLHLTSAHAKWYLNPSNGLSKAHECDRRQCAGKLIPPETVYVQ